MKEIELILMRFEGRENILMEDYIRRNIHTAKFMMIAFVAFMV
jgi:hypothetical protein